MKADYHTALAVVAKDGTLRLVAVQANDSPEQIGRDVIAAIHGKRLFQLASEHARLSKWRI